MKAILATLTFFALYAPGAAFVFQCADERVFSGDFTDTAVTIRFAGAEPVTLPRDLSTGRYTEGDLILSAQGDEWVIEGSGIQHRGCRRTAVPEFVPGAYTSGTLRLDLLDSGRFATREGTRPSGRGRWTLSPDGAWVRYWTAGSDKPMEIPVIALQRVGEPLQLIEEPDFHAPPPRLEGVRWRLIELGHREIVPAGAREVYLTLEKSAAKGFAGCNSMFGSYAVDGSKLRFGQVGSTRMACLSPTPERGYLDALTQTATFSVRGDLLEFFDAKGALLARFAKS